MNATIQMSGYGNDNSPYSWAPGTTWRYHAETGKTKSQYVEDGNTWENHNSGSYNVVDILKVWSWWGYTQIIDTTTTWWNHDAYGSPDFVSSYGASYSIHTYELDSFSWGPMGWTSVEVDTTSVDQSSSGLFWSIDGFASSWSYASHAESSATHIDTQLVDTDTFHFASFVSESSSVGTPGYYRNFTSSSWTVVDESSQTIDYDMPYIDLCGSIVPDIFEFGGSKLLADSGLWYVN